MEYQKVMDEARFFYTGCSEYFPHFRSATGTIGGRDYKFSVGFVGCPAISRYIELGRLLSVDTRAHWEDDAGIVTYAHGGVPPVELTGWDKINKFLGDNNIEPRLTTEDIVINALAEKYNIDVRTDREKMLTWLAQYDNRPTLLVSAMVDGKCPYVQWVGEK